MSIPTRLTFIGGGHLAQAILSGIYASKSTWKDDCAISVTARRSEQVEELKALYPTAFVTHNNLHPTIWDNADSKNSASHVVFICTLPVDVPLVCKELTPAINDIDGAVRPTIVTMCPGILVSQLQSWLPEGTPIVRSMPNTPVSCLEGSTALYPSSDALPRIDLVTTALRVVSPAVCVLPEENLLDVSAAISGSAPAHFFYVMESMIAVGVANGLSPEAARTMVVQSCLGSGMLSRESGRSMESLRKEVCVPGGSTEKAIAHLAKHQFPKIMQGAVEKSLQANREMRFVDGK
ncbi:Delta-1-pyrroline-5-carboxylate reductase apf3 [Cladobotryum mycophilum]|uniref:Delta-1-pyrroline-5-carboxylate reductase apf3 n=1 Tax=Cladobotryum mycophilum TaxID=491253 RepID=A0ABR0SP42_9HYPO